MCVGCESDADCPASASVCDQVQQACRGCELDAECGNGVCVEADGACVTSSDVVYVSGSGTDLGLCPRDAPCRTVQYGLQRVSATRPVLHLADGPFATNGMVIDRPVTIDGSGVLLTSTGLGPTLDVQAPSTLEGIKIAGGSPDYVHVRVPAAVTLRVHGARLELGKIEFANSTVQVKDSDLTRTVIDCTSGTVNVDMVRATTSGVRTSNCQVDVARSRFSTTGSALTLTGGAVRIVNNVFSTSDEFTDLLEIEGASPGSLFAFNTVVNLSSVVYSGVALRANANLRVTSSIFAYNSTNPLMSVTAAHSLFDAPAEMDTDTAGNPHAAVGTFFVDRVNGNFHLGAASPAKALGEPGIVTDDLEGTMRPRRAGGNPDVGAFEAD